MRDIAYLVLLIMALALCLYGLRCAWHMKDYIGTGAYWTNPWFYKGHAAIAGVIIMRLAAVRFRAVKTSPKENTCER